MPENDEREERTRTRPKNELDYNMLVTNTAWGTDEINSEVKSNLSKKYYLTDAEGNIVADEDGNPVVKEDNLWSKLGFFTRDFRLSNLNKIDYEKTVWWTEMTGLVQLEGMKKSAVYCFSQIAPTLELSQSKAGWYREIMNTMTQVSKNQEIEPKNKSLFGMKK